MDAYLDIDTIIKIALSTGVDADSPGMDFFQKIQTLQMHVREMESYLLDRAAIL